MSAPGSISMPAARGRRPASELAALRGRIEGFMLAGLRSPAIHRALTGAECPNPVVISERQVRAHMRAIERSWRERASGDALEADRAKALAMTEEVGRVALTRSTMHAGSNVGVGYLNAYLKASEQYARLRGLEAPVRTEIAGPGGGPLTLLALVDHPAEHLEPREEARRLHQLAADAEARADEADEADSHERPES
jgi:hypothetical protein